MCEPTIIYKNHKAEMAHIGRLYHIDYDDERVVNSLVDNLYAVDHKTGWLFLRCWWEEEMEIAELKYTDRMKECSGRIEICWKRIIKFTSFADKIEKILQRAKGKAK